MYRGSAKLRASLKNWTMDRVPKKKAVSVNFSHAMFSVLDFLTLKDGMDRSP